MEKPSAVPRPLAEQLLKRAVLMDEAEREALEAEPEPEPEGFTLQQLRAAAAETGVDPGYVDRAAQHLVREQTERSRAAVMVYGSVTGILAALAAAGLLAAGQLVLAGLFIVLDLLLVAVVLLGLDGYLRRGIAYLQGLIDDD